MNEKNKKSKKKNPVLEGIAEAISILSKKGYKVVSGNTVYVQKNESIRGAETYTVRKSYPSLGFPTEWIALDLSLIKWNKANRTKDLPMGKF